MTCIVFESVTVKATVKESSVNKAKTKKQLQLAAGRLRARLASSHLEQAARFALHSRSASRPRPRPRPPTPAPRPRTRNTSAAQSHSTSANRDSTRADNVPVEARLQRNYETDEDMFAE